MDINSVENNIAKSNPLLKKGMIAFLIIMVLVGTYQKFFDSKEVVNATSIDNQGKANTGSLVTRGFASYHGKKETEILCNALSNYTVYKSEKYDIEKDVCVVEYSTGSYQFSSEYKKYEVLTGQDIKTFFGDDDYKVQVIKEAFGSNVDYKDIYPKKPYVSPEDVFMSGSSYVSDKEGLKLCKELNTLFKNHKRIVGSSAGLDFYSSYNDFGVEAVAEMVSWVPYEKTGAFDKDGNPVMERPKSFEFTGAQPWGKGNCLVVFTKTGEQPSKSKMNYYSQTIPLKYLGAVTDTIKNSLEIRQEQYLDNKPYLDSIDRVERSIGVKP